MYPIRLCNPWLFHLQNDYVKIKWDEAIRYLSFRGGSDSKESTCNAGDPGLIPGLGRSPPEGNGNPLQYSCLDNSMDREAWQAIVHRVTKSWTRLIWSDLKAKKKASKYGILISRIKMWLQYSMSINMKTKSQILPVPELRFKRHFSHGSLLREHCMMAMWECPMIFFLWHLPV